jgi:hypothetical protein
MHGPGGLSTRQEPRRNKTPSREADIEPHSFLSSRRHSAPSVDPRSPTREAQAQATQDLFLGARLDCTPVEIGFTRAQRDQTQGL